MLLKNYTTTCTDHHLLRSNKNPTVFNTHPLVSLTRATAPAPVMSAFRSTHPVSHARIQGRKKHQ